MEQKSNEKLIIESENNYMRILRKVLIISIIITVISLIMMVYSVDKAKRWSNAYFVQYERYDELDYPKYPTFPTLKSNVYKEKYYYKSKDSSRSNEENEQYYREEKEYWQKAQETSSDKDYKELANYFEQVEMYYKKLNSYPQEKENIEKELNLCKSKRSFYYGMESFSIITLIIAGVSTLLLIILWLYTRKMKIVVTDKRVYGQTAFGKQVDLPFDSISAIGKSILKGIAVSTSSGRIRFLLISNRDDIYKNISDLLIQRQETKQEKKEVINVNNSNADELKKYKELLDSGVITQEEFNAKKKQLLGL